MATLTTPHYAFPYPDGAERVMDGDNAIAALAQSVDAKLHELTAVVGYVNVDMQSQWAIAIGFGATFVTPPAVFAIGHRAQAGTRRERDEAETRPVDEGEAEAKG